MFPAAVILIILIVWALFNNINLIRQAKLLNWNIAVVKFTVLLLLISVNSVTAQIKPSTAAERINGLQKRKLLDDNSVLKDIKFRNIGPSTMSGRVVDIDVNPADPTEFYVAYSTGGLWYTANNGQSLIPIFDKENVIGIGDIAVNWKDRIIWVGTGEANSSRSSYAGIGVYKSNDNGKIWQYLGLPESHHIGKIDLHPTSNNIAWVAVLGHLYSANKERGIYKTTDGGKTWKQTLYIDDNTGVVDMDINPKNPDELYAAAWYKTRRAWNFEEGGKTSGIYKSNDGGNTWKLRLCSFHETEPEHAGRWYFFGYTGLIHRGRRHRLRISSTHRHRCDQSRRSHAP